MQCQTTVPSAIETSVEKGQGEKSYTNRKHKEISPSLSVIKERKCVPKFIGRRDGEVRRYFRRKGQKLVPLPGEPGLQEFQRANEMRLLSLVLAEEGKGKMRRRPSKNRDNFSRCQAQNTCGNEMAGSLGWGLEVPRSISPQLRPRPIEVSSPEPVSNAHKWSLRGKEAQEPLPPLQLKLRLSSLL